MTVIERLENTVVMQLLELCDRVAAEIKPLTKCYQERPGDAAIVENIANIAEQRIRKARSILA